MKIAKPSHSNSTQLGTFNLTILSMMVMIELRFLLTIAVWMRQQWAKSWSVQCMLGLSFVRKEITQESGKLNDCILLSTSAQEWDIFQANSNTKHLQICTKHEDCGCLHANITMWSLAGFPLGLLHAIQTVTQLYSASGWSWLNYYNVTIFLHIVSQD